MISLAIYICVMVTLTAGLVILFAGDTGTKAARRWGLRIAGILMIFAAFYAAFGVV